MQKNNNNNNNNHHKPPRPPPLSVSLPSPPRPEPNPNPPLTQFPHSRPESNPKPALNELSSHSRPKSNPKSVLNELPAQSRPESNPKSALKELPAQSRPESNPKSALKEFHHSRPETKPVPAPKEFPHSRTVTIPKPALKELPHSRPEPNARTVPNDLPHSPLRSESPHRSDDPDEKLSFNNDTALVAVEKYYSPLTSPLPVTPPKDGAALDNFRSTAAPVPAHHIINFNRREELPPQSSVVHGGGAEGGGGGGERKVKGVRFSGVEDVGRRSRKDEVVKKVGLGVRVLEIVFCLISLSVMAANKTQGWSGDSFDRYKEYRFCLTVAVLGFVYSAFQAYDLGSYLATGKHVITHRFRYQFDFIMDQILAYLLISASSAAASRVDDWQANWGKDEFTAKASASISMAFLAFISFAVSSLISGYKLCNRDLY